MPHLLSPEALEVGREASIIDRLHWTLPELDEAPYDRVNNALHYLQAKDRHDDEVARRERERNARAR